MRTSLLEQKDKETDVSSPSIEVEHTMACVGACLDKYSAKQ
jgi:hypothetical protein